MPRRAFVQTNMNTPPQIRVLDVFQQKQCPFELADFPKGGRQGVLPTVGPEFPGESSQTRSASPIPTETLRGHARETPSPRDRCVFPARERTCRAVRAEQRNAHHLAGALLDRLRPLISVEVCLGEAWGNQVDLDPG